MLDMLIDSLSEGINSQKVHEVNMSVQMSVEDIGRWFDLIILGGNIWCKTV